MPGLFVSLCRRLFSDDRVKAPTKQNNYTKEKLKQETVRARNKTHKKYDRGILDEYIDILSKTNEIPSQKSPKQHIGHEIICIMEQQSSSSDESTSVCFYIQPQKQLKRNKPEYLYILQEEEYSEYDE